MVGALQVPQGLWRALVRSPKQFPIFYLFQSRCVFGQPEKEYYIWLMCLLTNVWKYGNI